MKKIIIATFFCVSALSFAAAQNVDESMKPFVNKQGISYLPEAGDFALGVDASPFLNYLGNFFNQAGTNEAPTFGNEFGIYGKYFIEDNQAIRVKLHLEFSKEKHKQTVPNDKELLIDPTNTLATGIDIRNDFNNSVGLSIGYELRRGKGRLQGFYGADFLLGYGSSKKTYEYANPITAANQSPSTTDWITGISSHKNDRPLKEKTPYAFQIGLGAFVGVEYFIAPQISLGGEVNVGFLYGTQGQNEVTSERFNTGAGSVQEYKHRKGKIDPAQVGLYTQPSGSLFMLFHF
ncbi:MAG: outer membrane beta-barrel protein [Dysgonamonadaceae bacterium]|jgi:hypothetical protein|nr:outer membrane beta-barrel protein [Dysgonamonadaceae bacterium]